LANRRPKELSERTGWSVTKRRWLVVLALILAALPTAAVVLYSIPVSTDAVVDGAVIKSQRIA